MKIIKFTVLTLVALILLSCLFSCGVSMEKIEKRAQKEGYTFERVSDETLAARNEKFDRATNGAGDIISAAVLEKNGKSIEVNEFDTVKAARAYVKHLETLMPFLDPMHGEAAFKDIKRHGRIVFTGDGDMIKELW
ncbi:MAG: hypothetical protein E7607_00275 [Ruminococcaceae bacterium]|nr:hypothetical protein [Oscillospiraceae bacterium]